MVESNIQNVELPSYAEPLFRPCRYKGLWGGRGSSKSYTVARILLLEGVTKVKRVLCAREYQNSINESVHKLLCEQIEEMRLMYHYHITDKKITGRNGTEFIFKGVKQNTHSIKSMQGLTDLWLEEAQMVSQSSWDILIPTIREPQSEIWATFNPENEDDPTYMRFVTKEHKARTADDMISIEVNWRDNPWFPDVLKREKDHMFFTDPELAMHIWEGRCRTHSDAQIFKNKWTVLNFETKEYWQGPYIGVDWGFSSDPTVIVEVYIDERAQNLYIRRENSGKGVELNDLPEFFSSVPNVRLHQIYADCSRPETISHVANAGFQISGAKKWKGSVEDGVTFLKSFNKIIIHEDCTETIKEARNYKYKVDRLSQKVTTQIVDDYNHSWDAVRYALNDIITKDNKSILDYL